MAYDGDGPVFVSNPSKTLWYRFYNLADNNYFFSDRDGLKYFDIMDISEERRLGYSWAGEYGTKLLKLAATSGYYTLKKTIP